MVRVKICGITNVEDALRAADSGADAIGFVFAESPRQVSYEQARRIRDQLPPFVSIVGVFVAPDPRKAMEAVESVGLDLVQLCGGEERTFLRDSGLDPRRLVRVVSVASQDDLVILKDSVAGSILLDTRVEGKFGGTGEVFDWRMAKEARVYGRPIILAGGLNPDNIEKAIEAGQPVAVDVSSGVESAPGKKDPDKVRDFIRRAKGYAA